MTGRTRQRVLISWVTLWVMLASALTPLVSHAGDRFSGRGWVEVCSAQGSKWVRSDEASASATPGSEAPPSLVHCALCLLPDTAPGVPPADDFSIALPPDAERPRVTLGRSAPVGRSGWVRAPSRAPPRAA